MRHFIKFSPRSLPTGSFPGSTQDFLLITQSVLVRTIRKAAGSLVAIVGLRGLLQGSRE